MADEGFRIWSDTLEGLFCDAWEAVLGLMIEDSSTLNPQREYTLSMEDKDSELLLFGFLGELLFLKDAQDSFHRPATVEITVPPLVGEEQTSQATQRPYRLKAHLLGEPIDRERHRLGTNIKAITFFGFSLRKTKEGFEAQIVVDT